MQQPERLEVTAEPDPAPASLPERYRWYHKVAGVAGAVFCLELGIFLVLYPWTDQWDRTYLAFLPAWFRRVWPDPYFRGAVSGLGLLNIYISFSEVFRLRRFSGDGHVSLLK